MSADNPQAPSSASSLSDFLLVGLDSHFLSATHFGTTTITTLDLVRYERSAHEAPPIPSCSLRMKAGVRDD